ncbi:hypothetical protein [Streptomyces aureocirculatus]|uniref:hypothetical protein n=1 Tax=Streptomyces aureocirculatus TaxID=67275 RepID=UPI0004C6CFD3|nr:hypothetical protein [Streptomyces aureocirculatus]
MRKSISSAAIAVSVLAGGVVLAAPAHAAESCTDPVKNDFSVTTPGPRPDLTFYVKNCADITGSKVTGHSFTSWRPVDPQGHLDEKRFTSFVIKTRIEARKAPQPPLDEDKVITYRTCDLTDLVNKHVDYTGNEDDYENPPNRCDAPAADYDKNLWWSTDSTVVYDIADDGKGAITQQVNGSALLH